MTIDDKTEQVASALSACDPNPRDNYTKLGMAVHDALGEAGFRIWDAWASKSDRYRRQSAVSDWKSFKHGKGVTVGTLFFLARQNGWRPDKPFKPRPLTAAERAEQRREQERREAEIALAQENAARKARHIVDRCKMKQHPYLAAKGFPDRMGLVDKWDNLVIPIYNNKREIRNIQMIKPDGEKNFLSGSGFGGCWNAIGASVPRETWLCEGYVTALSVYYALAEIPRQGQRVVCGFSTANVLRLAREQRFDYMAADNDPLTKDGINPGLVCAEATGLPFWIWRDIGDANDAHVERGLAWLADDLQRFVI